MSDGEHNRVRTIIFAVGTMATCVIAAIAVANYNREQPLPPPPPPPQGATPPPPPLSTPPPPSNKAIILSRKNGIQEVCVNSPDSIDSIQFHAWYNNGQGRSVSMTRTSDPACMYRVNLENSEGGTIIVNNDWDNVGDYSMFSGPGCSEVVRIEQGIIAASTATRSSRLGLRDEVNGRSEQWGWACKS